MSILGTSFEREPPHKATLLLREIRELSAAFERRLEAELAVNATDLGAMEHLIQDGPLSPTELSKRLRVSTAACTTIVDRLSAAGHASRIPNPTDRRGILVVPVPATVERALGSILPMVIGIDQVLASFSASEKAVITDYLARVVDVYRTHIA